MHVGQRIKMRRLELGLTQEELAKRLGYKSKSTINKIEQGINDLTQSNVVRFSKVLETTPSELVGWTDKEEDLADFHAKILKDLPLMDALEDYYKLDVKSQKIVRDLIHNMATED